MEEIHIAGTGIWYPDEIITNDEIVSSFNSYVDEYNLNNQEDINSGKIKALEHSSSDSLKMRFHSYYFQC